MHKKLLILIFVAVSLICSCSKADEQAGHVSSVENNSIKVRKSYYSDYSAEEIIPEITEEAVLILPTETSEETTSQTEETTEEITIGKHNALKKANTYLEFYAFSESGLIEQLKFDQFTQEEAEYAVDKLGY